MKITHIFPGCNMVVSNRFVKFVKKNFNESNHIFYIVCKQSDVSEKIDMDELFVYIDEESICDIIQNSEKVLLHSVFSLSQQTKKFILKNPVFFDKIYWISWGGDLYNWKINIKHRLNRLFSTIKRNYIGYLFIKNVKNFVGIFPTDTVYFKEKFKTDVNLFNVYYAGFVGSELSEESFYTELLKGKNKEKTKTVNIQVGHQANSMLNHIDALKKLEKFKNEDILIHIPLSYGDPQNAKKVEKKAKEMFGDKVICYMDFLSEENYIKQLARMDVFIFNLKRQIALFNIIFALCMGSTVYFANDSVLYKYFKSIGIDVFKINELKNLEHNQIIRKVDRHKSLEFLNETCANEKYLETLWADVFNS